MIDEKTMQKIRALESMYPDKRSLVMGALWVVQRDKGGTLTKEDLEVIAGILEISPVEVQAAATFYTMYNIAKPVGKYHIQVCANLSCSLLGAENLRAHLEKSLGIKTGETTLDGKFSLTTVECLGSCDTAPMMQINDDYYENLDTEKVNEILKRMR
ncbi:MAG: NAD(P)H-dependent oxidoreductase subunit E [Desulfobacteraceae bacterium]|nr:MAG: NAD(P)H-dependent oxidoreductase subunit E [Desulfobacteraceae bacterium]